MIEKYITEISVNTTFDGKPYYSYHGDGQGDFEQIRSTIKSVKLLDDYEEYLNTQLEYVKASRELFLSRK
jgi:hypothetical protein